MELLQVANAEDDIRETLEELVGQHICIKANMGRSKVMECRGTIAQTHPSVFLVEIPDKRNHESRASYNYIDVLMGSVELFYPDSGEPVFPWIDTSN